jgi:tetratricopeptide (TPR) repeat protein
MATSVDNPALGSPVEIFYSYSHKDEVLRDELEKHLSILKRQGVIRGWYDRKISAGSEWAGEIDEHLESARIVLLLISSDFLASDYCYDKEMMRAMERHNSGEAVIVPVILRDVDWSGAPFGKLQSLPTDVKAITSWPNRDAAFKDVAVGIRKAIEKMRADGTAAGPKLMPAAATPDCLPGICNLPHLRNPNFTGRDDLLKLLHDSLNPGKPAALTQAMHGLGGVGKTQTAVEYIYRHAAEYDLAWWIRAEEPAKLASDYAALAEPLKLRERSAQDQGIIVQAVRGSLAGCGRWLIVFDNATGPEEIRGYLPLGGTGHVLVTSRNPAFGGVAHPLKVEKMSADEAVEFLLKRTQQNDGAAAAALAKELGYLPLALAHAGAYMEETGTAIASYLKTFSARQTALLAKAKPPEDYPATVATTWEISFRAVEKESEAAGQLMDLCAFLAPDDIGREMLRSGVKYLPEPLVAAVADDLLWDEAVAALRRYSLVEVQDGALSVHRLVQAVVRDRLDEEERKKWAEVGVKAVNSAFPFDSDDVRTWRQCSRLLPHALTSALYAERSQVGLKACQRLLNQVGLYLDGRAELTAAESIYRRALKLAEMEYGPEHPEVAAVANNLGLARKEQGDFAGARTWYERALKIGEAAYGRDHAQMAIYVNNLGNVLRAQRDLAGARASFNRALKIAETAYGPDHPQVAVCLNSLGNVLWEQGDLAGARACYERALRIEEAAYGPAHPTVAVLVNNLGSVLRGLDDLVGARASFERALKIDEAAYGPDHPETATDANNLGVVLKAQGDLVGARACYARALKIRERVLGKDHPHTQIARNNLESLG